MKQNMTHKKAIIAGLIAISFILLIVSVIFFIDKTVELKKLDPLELESMTKEDIIQTIYDKQMQNNVPFYYFIPLFGFFGIVVGATIYFILSSDIEKKEKVIEHNNEIIFQLLNHDERKVVRKIVEDGGKTQQVEITYMEGFTKVKSHRIVEALAQKGILTKETMGKMRLIKLNKDIYELLKKKE